MPNKALVVDDSTTDLSNLKSILQEAGWMVATANNGEQALERAKTDRPNIIFMDIVMPQLDGYGASRALGEEPSTKNIRWSSSRPRASRPTRSEPRHKAARR